jgi:hypothetical protein
MEEKKKEKLTARVLEVAADEKKLSCKKAFAIAAEFDCLPAEIGKICNEQKIKIGGCQLGCF